MLPNLELKILGNNLYLETIKESDLPFIVHWRSQQDIYKWFFNTLGLPTIEVYQKWFNEEYNKDSFDYQFLIKLKEGQNIGTIALYDIKPGEIAERGRLFIIPEHRKKGYANEAAKLVLDFGFQILGLKTIKTSIYADNSVRLIGVSKEGFKEVNRYIRKEDGREVLDMILKREDFLR